MVIIIIIIIVIIAAAIIARILLVWLGLKQPVNTHFTFRLQEISQSCCLCYKTFFKLCYKGQAHVTKFLCHSHFLVQMILSDTLRYSHDYESMS